MRREECICVSNFSHRCDSVSAWRQLNKGRVPSTMRLESPTVGKVWRGGVGGGVGVGRLSPQSGCREPRMLTVQNPAVNLCSPCLGTPALHTSVNFANISSHIFSTVILNPIKLTNSPLVNLTPQQSTFKVRPSIP